MKRNLILIFCLFYFIRSNSQENSDYEYLFINKIVKPHIVGEIEADSIFLEDKFISLKSRFKSMEGLLRTNWTNRKGAPIELFIKNFSLLNLENEFDNASNDTIINFEKLKSYFKPVNRDYILSHPKKTYLSISKPIFNTPKDWCVMVKSSFTPYLDVGGGTMFIYVKIDDKWVLYHNFTIWFS